MSSDIPRAREIIKAVLQVCVIDRGARRELLRALALMTRAPPIRRAKRHRCRITPNTRRKIRNLSRTNMTMHQIAEMTGVHNIGRVSDVLHGRR